MLQPTFFKAIIVVYLIYLFLNNIVTNDNFFHGNAEFGFWTMISFIVFSSFILFVDFVTIMLVSKFINEAKRKRYILIIQSLICIAVYIGLNMMFKYADKFNELALNIN